MKLNIFSLKVLIKCYDQAFCFREMLFVVLITSSILTMDISHFVTFISVFIGTTDSQIKAEKGE